MSLEFLEREKHFNQIVSACDNLKYAMSGLFQNDIPIDINMITRYQNDIQNKLDDIRDAYFQAQTYLHKIRTKRPLCTCNHCGSKIEFDEKYISIDSNEFAHEVFTCPKCNAPELWDNMD
ncbi:MAG: hypothetical protein ACRCXT_15575 [Paraclostridium sp.]